MKIESYKNNSFAVQSNETSKTNKQTNINKTDHFKTIKDNSKAASNDVLDISRDVLKIRLINSRIESGFYNNEKVLQETAQKILKSL